MTSQRLGLTFIVITLAVIGAGAVLLLDSHREQHLSRMENHGTELIGVLSRMPLEALAPDSGQQGPLDLLASGDGHNGLAYAEVTDSDGVVRASMSRIAVLPAAAPAATPADWNGMRRIDAPGGKQLREYFAPILTDGARAGHIRIGLHEPGIAPTHSELKMLALLALTAFALVPVFYYLVRREVRPLAQMGEEIRRAVADNPIWNVTLARPSDVREFVASFNQLVRTAEERMKVLEAERSEMRTQSKVVSYAKARIESVLQSMPEGVLVLDEAGSVAYVNDKIGPMLGVNTGSMEGEQPAAWSPNPELTAWLNGAGQTRGKSSVKGTLEIADAEGSGRIAVSAYPLFSPRERLEVLGTLVVFKDVTAESIARESRKDLIAQLSHELKTPLHVMGMYSEMLLEDDADAEAIRIEAGNVIHDEVERVTAFINNMLSISRIEMGSVQLKRRRTRLGDLLQDALDNVSRSGTGRDLQFSLESAAGTQRGECGQGPDAGRHQQPAHQRHQVQPRRRQRGAGCEGNRRRDPDVRTRHRNRHPRRGSGPCLRPLLPRQER